MLKSIPNRLQKEGQQWLFQCETNPVNPRCRGGLLCDEPGLGKTLTMLMHILEAPLEVETLVVCPGHVIDVWLDQIAQHTNLSRHHINVYHGRSRLVRPAKIHLTSYGVMVSELQIKGKKEPSAIDQLQSFKDQSLFAREFYRIVLDEGHYIRNRTTHSFRGSLCLRGKHKWIITATPASNRLDEYYSYFRFLDLINNLKEWRQIVPSHSKDLTDESRQRLFTGVCELGKIRLGIYLKRTKRELDLQLPSLTEHTHIVEFSQIEQRFYQTFYEYTMTRVRRLDLLRDSPEFQNYSNSLQKNKLSLILRLRQACISPILVLRAMKKFNKLFVGEERRIVELSTEQLKYANRQIDIEGEECPICYDAVPNLKLHCGHLICQDCWTEIQHCNSLCPTCRNYIPPGQWTDLKLPQGPPKILLESIVDKHNYRTSSKIEEALRLAQENLPHKTIIVSQWTTVLDMVQKRLGELHLSTMRIDGKVSLSHRHQLVHLYQTLDEPKIGLLSLSCSSEGITLTRATRMIYLDQWWNKNGRVEQMSNRIHRLGQTIPVEIYHLHISNTIEDEIAKYLERKAKIVGLVDQPEQLIEDDAWWYQRVALCPAPAPMAEHEPVAEPEPMAEPVPEP